MVLVKINLDEIKKIKGFKEDGYKIVGIDGKEYYLNVKYQKLPYENAKALEKHKLVKILREIK